MKLRLAVAAAVLLAANFAGAESVQTVLTTDSTVYAIATGGEHAQLELTRRRGDVREPLIVPSTEDEAIETDPRIAFEDGVLYVLWHRQAEGAEEILLTTLSADDEWSEPRRVAGPSEARIVGLQMTLTHVVDDNEEKSEATLVNAAWWEMGADEATPRYAIVAFDKGQHLSTELADLRQLAELQEQGALATLEETGAAIHPPLALSRAGSAVDVVFGGRGTTAVTRVRVEPRGSISSEARLYRPGGRSVRTTTPARFASENGAAVQAFVSGERIVLYTPDAKFRYSVFENGEWTPVRMIGLDENLSSDVVVEELHRTIEAARPDQQREESQ